MGLELLSRTLREYSILLSCWLLLLLPPLLLPHSSHQEKKKEGLRIGIIIDVALEDFQWNRFLIL